VLFVGNTGITDLTPVSELKKLTVLFVGYTGITDLTPISGLEKLTWLSTPDGKSHIGRKAVQAAIAALSD
jgi:Leucine-rich repeat (LRR) protein